MRKGDRCSLTIERLSLGGEGIGRVGGMAVFVPYAAPGDHLQVELSDVQKRFARARLIRILAPSPDRVQPRCPYHFTPELQAKKQAAECGGCAWQHLRYEAQLLAKGALVQETLERIGGLREIRVKPVLGMTDPWRYRNKVQQPVGWNGKHLISGFFAPHSHDIVPIDDCLVQPELSVRLINRAKALLQQYGLRAYSDTTHQGWIRHLLVRTAGANAMLSFVTRTSDFPHEKEIVGSLAQEFPDLAGIHQNVNPARTNVILGRFWRTLAGAKDMEHPLGSLHFHLSPGSFFQVNTPQTVVLYNVVKRMAGRGERLLDLYCGVGTITLWLASEFRETAGIEEVRAAIDDALLNAERNGIENVRFQAMPVEVFLRNIPSKAGGPGLTITLDPPRAGCERSVIEGLLRLKPGRIVYVSCDPGTLARDAALLRKGGYRVNEVQPVDLFPHTAHIETVMSLTR